MASSPEAGASAAALARSQARAILGESRFRLAPVPRPLHGVLHAIGSALESPLNTIEELVASVGNVTPGGTTVVWGALAALVLALSALLTVGRARRALRDAPAQVSTTRPRHARELEREAEAAEREGRNADAVRLRFRAGLMRLAEVGRLEGAPSMLNAEVSRALASEQFDKLARRFEEIAYGGQAAAAQDAQASRRLWSELLRSRGR
jgi:HAMP domain-containing protein